MLRGGAVRAALLAVAAATIPCSYPRAFCIGPGANDVKMPPVPGFEPVIDPSRVISR